LELVVHEGWVDAAAKTGKQGWSPCADPSQTWSTPAKRSTTATPVGKPIASAIGFSPRRPSTAGWRAGHQRDHPHPVPTAGIGLIVLRGADGVRVEVHDGSPELPEQRGPGGWDDETGRGLGLVATQATRWGVHADAHGHGKAVWFEVHT
jgi:hypothetical protein